MQNLSIVKRPTYAVESVDNALQLILLLQEREWLRIAEAAKALGVAPSTAHRLMATLVYRGFALQDDQRRYCAGPMLRSDAAENPLRAVVALARPHIEALARSVRETVNLVERVGVTARFLCSAEGPQLLRIGNRAGSVLPAHVSSAGKAALSTLPVAGVTQLYAGRTVRHAETPMAAAELQALQEELAEIRIRGYALNLGRTEAEIAAVGAPVGGTGRTATLALSISAPLSRAGDIQQAWVIEALRAACAALRHDLDAAGPTPSA